MRFYFDSIYPLTVPNGTGVVSVDSGVYIVPSFKINRFHNTAYGPFVENNVYEFDNVFGSFLGPIIYHYSETVGNSRFYYDDILKFLRSKFPFYTSQRILDSIRSLVNDKALSLTLGVLPKEFHRMDAFGDSGNEKEKYVIEIISDEIKGQWQRDWTFLEELSNGHAAFPIGTKLLNSLYKIVEIGNLLLPTDVHLIASLFYQYRFDKEESYTSYYRKLTEKFHRKAESILEMEETIPAQVGNLLSASNEETNPNSTEFTRLVSRALGEEVRLETSKIVELFKECTERVFEHKVDDRVPFSAVVFNLEELLLLKTDSLSPASKVITVVKINDSAFSASKVYDWLEAIKDKKIESSVTFTEFSGIKLTAAEANEIISVSDLLMSKTGMNKNDSSLRRAHVTGVSAYKPPDVKFETNPYTHLTY